MSGHQLVAAVRAGRAHAVREALWAGAGPETEDAGADPLRPLPDGSTPLLRAVISGNAGLTAALLRHAADRLTEEDRAELLACARRWCGTGAEAGLRLATGATGPAVLAAGLRGLTYVDDPAAEELGPAHRAHPDPRVRRVVPSLLHRTRYAYTHPEAWDVLAALARDPDARVRAAVCECLYEFEGREPACADILAGFLGEDDQLVRVKAVSGLALADDPRCVEGARLIGPVDRAEWDSWLLDAAARYVERHHRRAGCPLDPTSA
ncbi:HEAT repeat domain-containing protein [Streptomyces sp. NPDC091040]|uniref:HEAT repeat domain-containing protein n=1 Tax=Streptomyces sp. NPDC091040 TaxID=3365972 RepID=UPI00380A623D